MKDSIKKIIFGIAIVAVIIVGNVFFLNSIVKDVEIQSKTMDFTIKDGEVFGKEHTILKVKNEKDLTIPIISKNLTFYKKIKDRENSYFNEYFDEGYTWTTITSFKNGDSSNKIDKYNYSVEVKVNNRKIETNIEDILSNDGNLYIDFSELKFLKKYRNITVQIDMSYKANDCVIDYNGIQTIEPFFSCERFGKYGLDTYFLGNFKNLTVNVNSDVPIDGTRFNVDDTKIIQNSNKSYTMKLKDVNTITAKGLYIFLGDNVIDNINEDKYVDEIINLSQKTTIEDEDYFTKRSIIYSSMIVSIILLVASIYINNKKGTKNYNKNFENLVSPILAETIIDGKTDLKNLIMSAIIELHTRGNIEIINDQTITINNYNNLKEYEMEILNLIFPVGTRTTTFTDINSVFKKSTKGTSEFSKGLAAIKVKILECLYDMKILSKELSNISRIITSIAILLLINITSIILFFDEGIDTSKSILYLFVFSAIAMYVYWNKSLKQSQIKEEAITVVKAMKDTRSSISIAVFIVALISLVFKMSLDLLNSSIELFLLTLIMIVLNIIIVKINNGNVLTSYGKKERLKLLELKNYINEYSLIKDRDLKAVVIWDEYLAYATAFGIPSKITSQIYENWYNMNITLQFISSVF